MVCSGFTWSVNNTIVIWVVFDNDGLEIPITEYCASHCHRNFMFILGKLFQEVLIWTFRWWVMTIISVNMACLSVEACEVQVYGRVFHVVFCTGPAFQSRQTGALLFGESDFKFSYPPIPWLFFQPPHSQGLTCLFVYSGIRPDSARIF